MLHLHVATDQKEIIVSSVQGCVGVVWVGWWGGCRDVFSISISMLVFKFIKSETHLFICSCVLGVGWWWVVGMGVYSPSPCCNWPKRNYSVKFKGVGGRDMVVVVGGVYGVFSISLSMLVFKFIKIKHTISSIDLQVTLKSWPSFNYVMTCFSKSQPSFYVMSYLRSYNKTFIQWYLLHYHCAYHLDSTRESRWVNRHCWSQVTILSLKGFLVSPLNTS